MKYRVRHETSYRYSEPVSQCQNVVRLRPVDDYRQRCLSHRLTITPRPAAMSERVDFYGNSVNWISIESPHELLSIVAQSDVEVPAMNGTPCEIDLPWETARAQLLGAPDPASIAARQYAFDSPHVARASDLAAYATQSFLPGRGVLESAIELTQRMHADFRFVPGVTSVGTPVLDVLHRREGVCQDFAHVLIGCLRSLGLPARYVSGYIATVPPVGQERLVGADASHAWSSLFIPGRGWIELDPTNGIVPTDGHISAAWGRDYEDVSPVRGVIVGGGRHTLNVAVDVIPIEL